MIRLTAGNDGADLWVDPEAIQTVREFGGQTRIHLTGGNSVQVREDAAYVLGLIAQERVTFETKDLT